MFFASIQQKAREFARSLPEPAFYREHREEAAHSERVLATAPQLAVCKKLLAGEGNLGHGLRHAEAVARDAGILVQIETASLGFSGARRDELILATQVAALLHDIKRAEPEHALAGAEAARGILMDLDIPEEHKPRIVTAIKNHEAHKPTHDTADGLGQLLSGVLYDADKFRWGPDNFTDTLWLMLEAAGRGVDLDRLRRRWPQSLEYIAQIKGTFRTEAGKRYGPEFIDQGIEIGQAIFGELSGRGSGTDVITDLNQLQDRAAVTKGVVTLGNFDGLHLGHQRLVRSLVGKAKEIGGTSIVFTFHPHPLKILAPETCPPLITTYEEKVELLSAFGVDLVLMIPFTRELSELSARDFAAKILKEKLGAREIFVGFNFRFGRDREGTVERLREFGRELGFNVTEVREVTVEGEVVSSTKIRTLIKAGNVEHAAKLLGRPYAVTGRVGVGDQRGRKLGFPTANVEARQEIMPYPGVYAIRVLVDGRRYDGVANAGFRPTFDKHEFCLEAHLFDFSGDLYGKEVTVVFVAKLRDEKRFESLEALVSQMHADVKTARDMLSAS